MSKGNSGGGANLPTGNGAGSTPVKSTSGTDWVKPAGAVGANEVAVKVSVSKLDKAWQQDKENYVGKSGGNQGKQKLENAKEFIRNPQRGGKKVPVEMPRATYDHKTGKVSFTDGRHRTAAARDLGKRTIYITVPRSQAETVKKKLGA